MLLLCIKFGLAVTHLVLFPLLAFLLSVCCLLYLVNAD